MIRFALILIALLLPFSSSYSQSRTEKFSDITTFPTDAHGKVIRSLIDASNSSNPELIKKFLLENASEDYLDMLPIEEHVGRIAGIGQANGGFDFYAMRQSAVTDEDKDVRELIIKGRASGDWFQVMISFTGSTAPKITSMGAKPMPAPSAAK